MTCLTLHLKNSSVYIINMIYNTIYDLCWTFNFVLHLAEHCDMKEI